MIGSYITYERILRLKQAISNIRHHSDYKRLRGFVCVGLYLACLCLAQFVKACILAIYAGSSILAGFYGAQAFGLLLEGVISDVYKRSSVLNWVLLALGVCLSSFLVLGRGNAKLEKACIYITGLAGNSDVVSRAGIVDILEKLDRRQILSFSILSEAVSWIVVGVLVRYFSFSPYKLLFASLCFTAILLILSLFFNTDKTQGKKKIKEILLDYKQLGYKFGIAALLILPLFLFGELGYFPFFYNQENNIANAKILADSYLSWFIGMSAGALFSGFFRKTKDIHLIILGFSISMLSLGLFTLGGSKNISVPGAFLYDSIVYTLSGLGSGIYLTAFYSYVSKRCDLHHQGAGMGIIDSIRVIGDFTVNIPLMFGIFTGLLYHPIAASFLSYFIALIFAIILSFYRQWR